MNEDLLSTRAAASLLGVGTTSIKRWSAEGILPCIKTAGGHRRFRRADVLSLRKQGSTATSEFSLSSASAEELDALDYGVIGFDDEGIIFAYNRFESEFAGYVSAEVIGTNIFSELVPCANNSLVRGRFVTARDAQEDLHHEMSYVFTYRMAPTPVRLELRREHSTGTNWLLVRLPS